MKKRLTFLLSSLSLLLLSALGCSLLSGRVSDEDVLATSMAQEAASLRLTGEAVEPTVDALATQRAMPTPTLTPAAGHALYDGGDGWPTSLVWNVTSFGIGSGGSNRTLATVQEGHNYLFIAEAETSYRLQVDAVGEGGDPRFTLIDPDGRVILQADNTHNVSGARASITLLTSGVYTLRVSAVVPNTTYVVSISDSIGNGITTPVYGSEDGKVTIEVAHIRSSGSGLITTTGEAINFLVEGNREGTIVVSGDGVIPTLSVIDPSGRVIAQQVATDDTLSLPSSLVESGTYTLRVGIIGIHSDVLSESNITVSLD